MNSRLLVLLTFVVSGCTTVRQLREGASLPATGQAERTRAEKALDYSVAIKIAAPPATIWAALTDAESYPKWNSSVVKLDGTVARDAEIKLVATIAPDRTFELKVSTFEPPLRMVWEDGGSMFLGVRNFTLIPADDGTTIFAMSETFSGGMLGMIEGSLPDFTESFNAFAADLKKEAEGMATTVAR